MMKKLPVYQINKFHCASDQKDLYVNDFKSHLVNNDFIEHSHSHNFYLIVLFTKGTGVHMIDFDTFQVKAGCLYFLKPGQVHSWQLSADIDGYIVFCSQHVYNLYFAAKHIDDYSFYRTLRNSPELLIDQSQIVVLIQYFEMLLAESQKQALRKTELMMNILDTIFITAERAYDAGNDHSLHSYNVKIGLLENLLEQHFKHQKMPSFYADEMNMSLKHLNRICRHTLDMTLTEVIYNKIILESKRLLSIAGTPVGEVATVLGFENYSYFTKVFKKYAGVTPQQFKKQLHSSKF